MRFMHGAGCSGSEWVNSPEQETTMKFDHLHEDRILILDFGSQYTQLIARRVRESHVYCEIHPFNMAVEAIRDFQPKGIILSGGPSSVHDPGAPLLDRQVF